MKVPSKALYWIFSVQSIIFGVSGLLFLYGGDFVRGFLGVAFGAICVVLTKMYKTGAERQ